MRRAIKARHGNVAACWSENPSTGIDSFLDFRQCSFYRRGVSAGARLVRAVGLRWEPGGEFRPNKDEGESYELQAYEGEDADIERSDVDFRRRDPFDIEEGEPNWGGQERGLKADREEDCEPNEVESEFDNDGGDQRKNDERDFDPVEKKAEEEGDEED